MRVDSIGLGEDKGVWARDVLGGWDGIKAVWIK